MMEYERESAKQKELLKNILRQEQQKKIAAKIIDAKTCVSLNFFSLFRSFMRNADWINYVE